MQLSIYFIIKADQSEDDEDAIEEEGRRFNLATRVMSNGVEVIVAGTTPAYRWENANPHPTLTLSEAVVMHLPQDKPNDFITKTCTTTFTYLNTVTRDGSTMILTDQQVKFTEKFFPYQDPCMNKFLKSHINEAKFFILLKLSKIHNNSWRF